jgi:hypothetical protein
MTSKHLTPTAAGAAKALAGWIEVFKAGAHTDSAGKRFRFNTDDLDQMAYNHALGAAPAVLGHPKHDDPAYAWVDSLKREGDSLYAQFKDVNPAFEKGVQDGAYRNRSVAVYKDADHGWRVRHVGWLGAVPPAIDGLRPIEFAAPEADCLEFSAPGYSLVWGLESLAGLVRSLRDSLIAKDGVEAANAVLPQYQIDSAMEAAAQARQEFQESNDMAGGDDAALPLQAPASLYQQPQPEGVTMTITQEQLDAANAAAATARAETDALRAEFAAVNADAQTLRAERQTERIQSQINGWKAAGKVLPAEEPGLLEYMRSLDNLSAAEFTFAKAEGGEAKLTPAQFHAASIEARLPQVKLGARAAADTDPVDVRSPESLADGVRVYMKEQSDKGLTVSLSEAVAHVGRGAL